MWKTLNRKLNYIYFNIYFSFGSIFEIKLKLNDHLFMKPSWPNLKTSYCDLIRVRIGNVKNRKEMPSPNYNENISIWAYRPGLKLPCSNQDNDLNPIFIVYNPFVSNVKIENLNSDI